VDAALGSQTFPWLADWSATSVTVEQATIGAYCGGNEVPCADLTVAINGTTYGTVADPCGATAAVNVHDTNGNDVGSLVSGSWVVAAPANTLREYTASDTWNKPASSSFFGAFVVCVGAGAGGACGDLRTGTAVQATGGSGAGGGWVVWDFISAASLSGTEAVTGPTGGAGAAGLSVAGTGIAGTNGGDASFGAHVIALGGRAGTGKTVMAIAAGLEQVVESRNYERLAVYRPLVPVGRADVGFLPGGLDEKLDPWMSAIHDAIVALTDQRSSNDARRMIDDLTARGQLSLESVTFLRGRSLHRQFVVVDEAQNLEPTTLKTILTRIGEGTKVVFTGDTSQIDAPYMGESNNALAVLIHAFAHQHCFGHVTLASCERSEVASLAAELL
jgi:hypothetical protein